MDSAQRHGTAPANPPSNNNQQHLQQLHRLFTQRLAQQAELFPNNATAKSVHNSLLARLLTHQPNQSPPSQLVSKFMIQGRLRRHEAVRAALIYAELSNLQELGAEEVLNVLYERLGSAVEVKKTDESVLNKRQREKGVCLDEKGEEFVNPMYEKTCKSRTKRRRLSGTPVKGRY